MRTTGGPGGDNQIGHLRRTAFERVQKSKVWAASSIFPVLKLCFITSSPPVRVKEMMKSQGLIS